MKIRVSPRAALRIALCAAACTAGTLQAATVDELLNQYRAQGAQAFDAARAQQQWTQEFRDPKSKESRSCTTCHGRDLKQAGKHATTGKVIEPLAPSANRDRLTDAKHIEKWFKRNCTWVLDRECTPQEKGDFLVYIQQQ